MRIIGAALVVFNHTGENGFVLFSKYKVTDIQFLPYLRAIAKTLEDKYYVMMCVIVFGLAMITVLEYLVCKSRVTLNGSVKVGWDLFGFLIS